MTLVWTSGAVGNCMPDKKSASIRELFLRNKRGLLDYLTRRVGRADAPDLLQETFLRVLDRGAAVEIADPAAYLRRTAANLATDHGRRGDQEAKLLVFDAAAAAPSEDLTPEERVDAAERARRLFMAIEVLPPRCRQVFTLRMRDKLPPDEIARRLRISRKMVDRHLQIAIERCRKALK
jgi:RNA polymerase sigma factor (sigma-70 family)